MVIGLRSQLIKQYDWSEKKQLKSWKAHMSPIMAMTFDPSSTLLAIGSQGLKKGASCVQKAN